MYKLEHITNFVGVQSQNRSIKEQSDSRNLVTSKERNQTRIVSKCIPLRRIHLDYYLVYYNSGRLVGSFSYRTSYLIQNEDNDYSSCVAPTVIESFSFFTPETNIVRVPNAQYKY